MEKDDLRTKVNELFEQLNENLKKDFEKVINSGSIDFESYENNYLLPKIVLTALLKEQQFNYKLLADDKKIKREVDNIYRMI